MKSGDAYIVNKGLTKKYAQLSCDEINVCCNDTVYDIIELGPGDVLLFLGWTACRCSPRRNCIVAMFLTKHGVMGEHFLDSHPLGAFPMWEHWYKYVKRVDDGRK